MKSQKAFSLICILIIIVITGFAQNNNSSEWVIDKTTLFTCQSINYSEKTDTVVFQKNVYFTSEFVQINNAEKIIYNKQTKKLIIFTKDKGSLKMNDNKNGMKLISNISLNNSSFALQ